MRIFAISSSAALAAMLLFTAGCFTPSEEKKEVLTKADIQLEYAVRHSKSSMVKKALAQKADPNTFGRLGRPVLMEAVMLQNQEIIRLLLENGANVNIRDASGDTPLHAAVASRITDIPELLLRNHADPNAAGKYKRTPIMEAARLGRIENVRLLLRYNADPSVKDEFKRSISTYAALAPENGVELFKIITDPAFHIPRPDELDLRTSPLLASMLHGQPETVEYLLGLIKSFREENFQPLGQVAMRISIEFNQMKWVQLITEKGLDLNRTLPIVFRAALLLNVPGVYKLMARNDIIDRGYTPLIWAAIFKRPEIATYLIEHGARTDVMSNEGQVPIDYANDSATHRAILNAEKALKKKQLEQDSPQNVEQKKTANEKS